MPLQLLKYFIVVTLLLIFTTRFFIPQHRSIPVQGATAKDWNPHSFWHYPWGRSGVHKGIDIFAQEGAPVVATTDGVVVYTGNIAMGGNVVLVLGTKWRFYYYAHLRDINASQWQWLAGGEQLGSVGSTGNAQGKPPHLHFAIISLWPMLNQYDPSLPQAWMKMFYVDPDSFLK